MLFHLSFWIKEKSVVSLANRHLRSNAKHTKSLLPAYHRTGDSVGEFLKSGVTLGLHHLYFLSFSLYDMVAEPTVLENAGLCFTFVFAKCLSKQESPPTFILSNWKGKKHRKTPFSRF